MSKFSVKKPYTILVMVLVIIMLGAVSLTKMQMDLLPEISLPYIMIITTYPGASPEKVESTICEPMESALGTISGVENVYSSSNENYGFVELEFADGTDMDSVMVKVYTALETVKDTLPDECGTPSIMEISMDMLATQYLAVAYDGKDIEELSRFVENTVTPEIERQDGVASVTTMGLIEQTVQIELDQDKVDKLNDKILGVANDAFEEAMEDLEEAKQQLEDSQKELDDGKQELIDAQQELENSKQDLMDAQTALDEKKQDLVDGEQELEDSQKELDDGKADLETAKQEFEDSKQELEDQKNETYTQLATASQTLEALETYRAQLTSQKATLAAVEAAIDSIGGNETLTQLQDAVTALTGLKQQVDAVSASLPGDEALGAEQTAQVSAISAALSQTGIDTSSLDSYLSSGSATGTGTKTILTGYSTGIQTQIDGFQETLGSLPDMLEQYQSQKTALELEIQVTKGMISAYEKQLKQAGIDYTDIEKAKMEAAAGFGSADAQMAAGQTQLDEAEASLDSAQEQIDSAKEQLEAGWDSMADGQEQINSGWDSIADGQIQIDSGWESLEDGQEQIDEGWESYYDGLKQFEKQRKEALRSANADQLLTLSTLSSLIYAQNFEMPAGYIDDEDSNSWLLKVGENYDSIEDLEDMVLCNIDDVGDVRLKDVANITILDNTGTTYTKLNGSDAVILSVFKASTSGTNEVSKTCKKAIQELEEEYDGLSILIMSDQGDYISLIVDSVVKNMALGAALAILILALFLKDFMPTIVVAISIPLSVLTCIVAMYFSGISLNMMSLSGMALGIGMLVDNSIVVIENIYRLRGRSVEAPRAAVQGTKQVAGAVISSTLTSICVFFPIVFTSGMTRELLLPMSLTIIYCLLASLFIAMTVVPASASTLLRKTKAKKHPLFEKIQDFYGKTLAFCLKVKLVPLALAVGLLAFSIWLVVRMGIVMIPDMTSNQIEATVTFEKEDTDRAVAYAEMDELLDRVLAVEGVGSVGVISGDDTSLIVSTGTEDEFLSYSLMVTTENEDAGSEEVNRICDDIEAAAEGLDLTLEISTAMSEMSSLLGSGISITISGSDLDMLLAISEDLMDIIGGIEGFTEISNGQEDADQVLHLSISKDAAMSKGLSVAQIYADLAEKITTSADAITITIDDVEMDVEVVDETEPITVENLMDYTFAVTETDEDGDSVTVDVPLGDIAELETEDGFAAIDRKNQTRYITVSASVEDGYNATLLSRELLPLIEEYEAPDGYLIDVGGETETVTEMLEQMGLMILMGVAFIYFVMVAQFQSLLSPFIIMFTLPLAFTGGFLALWIAGEKISVIALMGLVVLLGTVVNNGIVFVDYVNQLRKGGMERRAALIATGKTRMRPILMTAMTTILAEASMIFGDDMASQMGKGMALVIAGGLAYATLMTLYIIPVMYDILFKRAPLDVDTGSEDLDDVPDDAQEFMQQMLASEGGETES